MLTPQRLLYVIQHLSHRRGTLEDLTELEKKTPVPMQTDHSKCSTHFHLHWSVSYRKRAQLTVEYCPKKNYKFWDRLLWQTVTKTLP